MPRYEMECNNCGYIWVLSCSLSQYTKRNLIKCPACQSSSTFQKIGSINFILKGGGWAKDGYNNKQL